MLRTKNDYRYLTENALARIAIEGKPYPVRAQKLILTGEDEAYLREAIMERQQIASGSISQYDKPILKITQANKRAWYYGSILGIADTWSSAEAIRTLAVPSGVVAFSRGRIERYDGLYPPGVENAIKQYQEAVNNAGDQYSNKKEAADNQFTSAKKAAQDRHREAVQAATTQYDTDTARAAQNHQSEESSIEKRHASVVEEINAAYQAALDKGDDPVEAKAEYDAAMLEENNDYKWKLLANDDLYDKNESAAYNTYAETISDAAEALSEAAKSANEAYQTALDNAKTEYDSAIQAAEETRNNTIYSAVNGKGFHSWWADYWQAYTPAVREMEAERQKLKEQASCLQKYLRKTPEAEFLSSSFGVFKASYIVHAPAADATMRAFADLERAVGKLNIVNPYTVYRAAHTETWPSGSVERPEAYASRRPYIAEYYVADVGVGSYDVGYSSTEFYIYYGKRHEIDRIKEIWVTYEVYRYESEEREEIYHVEPDPDIPDDDGVRTRYYYVYNRTHGLVRVRLQNKGIVAQRALEAIDKIRDDLAEELAKIQKTRDDALADAQAAYLDAIAEADKTYDDSVAAATKEYDDAVLELQAAMNTGLEALEKTTNSAILDIENDENLNEGEKTSQIQSLMDDFRTAHSEALRGFAQRLQQLESEKAEKIRQASTAKNEAYSKASSARSEAMDKADGQYRQAYQTYLVDRTKAETRIETIKSTSEETVREDARIRWAFTAEPVDGKVYTGNPSSGYVRMEGVVDFDIIYEPKSLTGADFEAYYEEVDGE